VKTWMTVLGAVLLVVMCTKFAVRGPWRGLSGGNDFDTLYTQGRAWLHGVQIYERTAVAQAMKGSGRERFNTPSYPVTSSVVMAPFSWMPWTEARATWVAFNLLLVALQVWALIAAFSFPWTEPRTFFFLAMVVGLAPYTTGFGVGNPGMAAGLCAVLSICANRLNRPRLSGVLLALAGAFKFHVAAPVFLYYLLVRRWRVFLWGLASLAALTVVAIGWLAVQHVDLLESWRLWRASAMRLTGVSEDVAFRRFTDLYPYRFGMINLHVLLHCFTDNYRLVNALVPGFGIAAGLALAALTWKQRNDLGRLAAVSALAVLSLLVVYHRLYDAALLVLPIAWAFEAIRSGSGRWGWIVLIASTPFLLPGGSALTLVTQKGWIPDAVSQSPWWEGVVMPHQIWALLVILSVLTAFLVHQVRVRETATALEHPSCLNDSGVVRRTSSA